MQQEKLPSGLSIRTLLRCATDAGNAPSLGAITVTEPKTSLDSCDNTTGETKHVMAMTNAMRALLITTSENQNNKTHQAMLGANVR
jgi:hypothetical protein